MQKNNIIITILIILVIILGIGILYNNQKTHDALEKQQEALNQMASTTDANAAATNGVNTNTQTNTVITVPGKTTGTTTVNPTEVFPKQFILAVGGSFSLADGTTVTLNDLSDSRCPTDPNVRCVVAGDVIAKLTDKKGTVSKAIQLSYPGNSNTNNIVYAGYKISFDNVNPDRGLQSNPTAKKDYRLTFTVTRQ